MKTLLLAAALAAATPAAAQPQAIDCHRAQTCTDRQICGSPVLDLMDVHMTEMYFRLLNRSVQPAAVEASQVSWLRDRDACVCNPDCIAAQYEARIVLFETALRRLGEEP